MADKTQQDNQTLIAFWSDVFGKALEEQNREWKDLKDLAPSEKLYRAAQSLGTCQNVLDYGCGGGWAGLIAAASGCEHVTQADPAEGAVRTAKANAEHYGLSDKIDTFQIEPDWLSSVPDHTYDGFICSNVLDVIPPETAKYILNEAARIITDDAIVIIGMNYYMSPEMAEEKGIELIDRHLYQDGVLRMVSRTDEEWTEFFSPWYDVVYLSHFGWPNEKTERRRLFALRRH